MAEDSGAFKTNSAGWRQTRSFVMTWACDGPGAPWQRCLTRLEMLIRDAGGRSLCRFFTTASDTLRYSQFRLIRSDRRYPLSREHGQSVATAFPIAQRPSQTPCEGGTRTYAPRFPFSVRRDHAHLVDFDLWAWRGGAAARRSRGLCQQPVMARGPRNNICPARRGHRACFGDAACRYAHRREIIG